MERAVMNAVKNARTNSAGDEAAQPAVVGGGSNEIAGKVAAALQGDTDNERSKFPTLSTEQEIASLKAGKIPAEVIYSGKAGEKLSKIDHMGLHIYTLMINNGFLDMFISAGPDLRYSAKKLWECLGRMDTRIDIGTGNGIVSNMVAFPIVTQRASARLDREIDAIKHGKIDELQESTGKPRFIACDLSKASLSLAKDLANDHFHQLEKLFELEYYQGTFQTLLTEKKSETPRLITMFNVLANFAYEDLTKILTEVSDSMQPGDVFIPSFLVMREKKEIIYSYGVPFQRLTQGLYDNSETEDRCVSAFSERYKIDPKKIMYHVDRENDGRDFVNVTLSTPETTTLHIPTTQKKDTNLPTTECHSNHKAFLPLTTFSVFKSYRMTEEEIKKLCKSVGFEIDYRLKDREGMHLAPVLYKP